MRLIAVDKILPNQPGAVTIIPEEQDDLWLLQNLIKPNDCIKSETTRKVHSSSDSGKSSSLRVKFDLEIKIISIDYDKGSATLRIKGKTTNSHPLVNSGSFHTIEVVKNKKFELTKKFWDQVSIQNLKDRSNRPVGADVGVLLISPLLARFFLVEKSIISFCSTIGACGGGGGRVSKKNGDKYFSKVFDAFRKNIDFSILKCVVIAGPDTTKEEFRSFLLAESRRLKLKSIHENKARIVVITCDAVDKEGLKDVLSDTGAINIIKDTKSALEVRAIKELNNLLLRNSDKACYGPKSVDLAHEMSAIETLLITDELFRNDDVGIRQKYIELVNSVEKAGGKALVFSSMHVSGEELAKLTGIAAILRFPVPNLDDLVL